MKLHAIYGKGTKVLINDYGGYDFQDTQTFEFVADFNNYKVKHAALDFSDICDYILNKNPLVPASFAAVSSDIFKEDMNHVYSLADKTFTQQHIDETNFEQARKDTLARKQGMSLDIGNQNLKNKVS